MIDAMKYGMLGTLVGHEITHGFDNEGCLYNKIGKYEDWWTPADKQNFEKPAGRDGEELQPACTMPTMYTATVNSHWLRTSPTSVVSISPMMPLSRR